MEATSTQATLRSRAARSSTRRDPAFASPSCSSRRSRKCPGTPHQRRRTRSTCSRASCASSCRSRRRKCASRRARLTRSRRERPHLVTNGGADLGDLPRAAGHRRIRLRPAAWCLKASSRSFARARHRARRAALRARRRRGLGDPRPARRAQALQHARHGARRRARHARRHRARLRHGFRHHAADRPA